MSRASRVDDNSKACVRGRINFLSSGVFCVSAQMTFLFINVNEVRKKDA